jgi:hypothetical protein
MTGALLDRSRSSLVPLGRRGLSFAVRLVRVHTGIPARYENLETR